MATTSYDGSGMWGAIGQSVGAIGSIFATAKTAQLTADTLNKQSEINDRSFEYSMITGEQRTKNTITILVVVGAIVAVTLILLMIFKRKAG